MIQELPCRTPGSLSQNSEDAYYQSTLQRVIKVEISVMKRGI